MSFEEKLASYFGLKETKDWLKHANPWSAWTRVPVLPLLAMVLFYRDWFGLSVFIPVFILILWTFLNPVFFDAPESTRNWTSKAVLGEKIWVNRKKYPIESHHERMVDLLVWLQTASMIPLFYGLYFQVAWPTILGVTLVLIFKFWFLDRMVWIFEDMKTVREYKKLDF